MAVRAGTGGPEMAVRLVITGDTQTAGATARRVVLAVAQVISQLALQGAYLLARKASC